MDYFSLQCPEGTQGLSLRCLKGTSAYFDSEYHYLSPLAGAAFSQMHILQNLYDASLGTKLDRLAKELFHRLDASEPLRCTKNKSKPASWVSPRRMGELIALTLSKNEKSLQKWIQKISDESGGEKSGCSKKKVEAFVSLVHASIKEEDSPFYSFYPFVMLSTFAWMKSQAKSDLILYMKGIRRYLKTALNPSSPLPVSDEELEQFCRQEFSELDVSDRLVARSKETFDSILRSENAIPISEAEQIVYHASPLMESIEFAFPRIEKYEHVVCKHQSYPDCMETQLRNFVNLVMYNPFAREFQLDHLPPTMAPSSELKSFYQRQIVPRFIAAEWASLTVDLPGVEYIRQEVLCEVRPSIPNFVAVLNHLLGTNCITIADLSAHFSQDRRGYNGSSLVASQGQQRVVTVVEDPINHVRTSVYIGDTLQCQLVIDLSSRAHAKSTLWANTSSDSNPQNCKHLFQLMFRSAREGNKWSLESCCLLPTAKVSKRSSVTDIADYPTWLRIHYCLMLPSSEQLITLQMCIHSATLHPCFIRLALHILASVNLSWEDSQKLVADARSRGLFSKETALIFAKMKFSVLLLADLLAYAHVTQPNKLLDDIYEIAVVDPSRLSDTAPGSGYTPMRYLSNQPRFVELAAKYQPLVRAL